MRTVATMRFSPTVVGEIMRLAAQVTDGAVTGQRLTRDTNGTASRDHLAPPVLPGSTSRTAAREHAALYAGAAAHWARLTETELPPRLRQVVFILAQDAQPPRVRQAFAAGCDWADTLLRLRQLANTARATVGERRKLTLTNRTELCGWSGGREPRDPGSDVLIINNPDGTTVVVPLGGTVEYTTAGFRLLPRDHTNESE